MKNKKIQNYNLLSLEEKKLLNIYISEYNDFFQMILILPPKEFLENIIKRVEITLKKNFNDIPRKIKNKIEDYFTEKIYLKDLKLSSNAMKVIKNKLKENKISKNIFNEKIIEHCSKDKKEDNYIHSCGEKFYSFKYKPLNNLNLEEEQNKNINEIFLLCIKCEMIYKSNLIKFHCHDKKIDFYSKIIFLNNNNEEEKKLPFATWKKYHCNAIINDTMKCNFCKESLLFDKEKNKLFCKKCNTEFCPEKILWNCLICKKNFSCEIKEYNNLEFKNMRICIKDTLINKKKAFPELMGCDCKIKIENEKFYHKFNCKGELYLGYMNNKKIIVCNKCEAMSYYYNFIWTCPICNKRFKVLNNNNDNIDQNDNNVDNKNIEYNKNNHLRKNESVSPIRYNYPKSIKNNNINSPVIKIKKQLSDDESKEVNDDNNKFNDNYRKKSINKNSTSTAYVSENNSMKSEKNNLEENKNEKENNKNILNINNKNIEKENNQNLLNLNNKNKEEKEFKKYNLNDFEIIEQIGEGSFGKIFKVQSPEKKLYALKKIIVTNKLEFNNLQHEYNILEDISKSTKKSLDLINIIYKETKQIDSTTFMLYVIMELATSDWEKEIIKRRKNKNYYEEKELIKILYNLIKTFSELQKINISHRDIKPQNILYFKENNKFKLSDFGEAKELKNNINLSKQTLRGTQLFMSPILFDALKLRKKKYIRFVKHNIFKSDVYSFGLMSIYVASLGYESLYEIRELNNNNDIKSVLDKYLKSNYSDFFISLILKMVNIDEEKRCDFIQLEQIFQDII